MVSFKDWEKQENNRFGEFLKTSILNITLKQKLITKYCFNYVNFMKEIYF